MIDKRISDDLLEFKQQYVEFLNKQIDLHDQIAEKYSMLSLISESKRSQVFLVADKKTGRRCLMKVFDTSLAADKEPIIKHLSHPCIPKFIDMYRSGDKTYLIRQYFEGRSLADILQERGLLSACEVRNIASQICDV